MIRFLFVFILICAPLAVFADNDPFNTADIGFYQPSVDIPGVTDGDGLIDFADYINVLYGLAVVVGAILAVVMLVIAGVQYAASDVITSKSDAINRIQGALVGLLIILSTYLILQTINPQLANIGFIQPSTNPLALEQTEIGAGELNNVLLEDLITVEDGVQRFDPTGADISGDLAQRLNNVFEAQCIGAGNIYAEAGGAQAVCTPPDQNPCGISGVICVGGEPRARENVGVFRRLFSGLFGS